MLHATWPSLASYVCLLYYLDLEYCSQTPIQCIYVNMSNKSTSILSLAARVRYSQSSSFSSFSSQSAEVEVEFEINIILFFFPLYY